MSELTRKLIDLDGVLRAAGFAVEPAHHIEARCLLDELQRRRIDLSDPSAVAPYLGPVYCSDWTEQQAFRKLLADAWAASDTVAGQHEAPSRHSGASTWRGIRVGVKKRWRAARRRALRAAQGPWLVPAAALWVLLSWGLWGLWAQYFAVHALTGKVLIGQAPCTDCRVQVVGRRGHAREAVASRSGTFEIGVTRADLPARLTARDECNGSVSVDVPDFDQQFNLSLAKRTCPEHVGTRSAAGAANRQPVRTVLRVSHTPRMDLTRAGIEWLPLLIAVMWCFYWSGLRRAWLARMPGATPASFRELSADVRESLAVALGTRDVGHELRQREWVPSGSLDVKATLDSLFSGRGPPRLVFGNRVEPEYLALIDENSQADHLARLGEELLIQLERRDVGLTRYYFRGSPSRSVGPAMPRQPQAPGLPSVDLDELLARSHARRLIVVSDGASMFDGLTGQPEPWAQQLAQARQGVILTPLPEGSWGEREAALSRLGFGILPLTSQGLARLGQHYGRDFEGAVQAGSRAGGRPRWLDEPLSLMMPTAPVDPAPQDLCAELREMLGEAAYRLMQGASAYPEVHWGLTVRIGTVLLGRRQLAESLPRLAALPWFQQGYMPQWLRRQLTGTLTQATWRRVHDSLTWLLETAKEQPGGGIPLRIGERRRGWHAAVASARGLLARFRLLGRRPSSMGRMRRDAVFLSFLQGPPRLSVEVGELFKKLFFHDGLWQRGARALPAMLPALMITAAMALLWPPRHWMTVAEPFLEPDMVHLSAGSFVMGSPISEAQHDVMEGPQHTVHVPAFSIGRYDVTFEEWDACVADGGCKTLPSDSGWGRGYRPVINVSWQDAQQYAAWLSRKTGRRFRLPSESELEYATRAGTVTTYYWGNTIGKGNANCEDCGGRWDKQTAQVGSFAPNPWGLYDLVGNVLQWTQDCYHDTYQGAPTDGSPWLTGDCSIRVIRGGAWPYLADSLRSAARNMSNETNTYNFTGFRLASSD